MFPTLHSTTPRVFGRLLTTSRTRTRWNHVGAQSHRPTLHLQLSPTRLASTLACHKHIYTKPPTNPTLTDDDPYHIRLMLGEFNLWSGDLRKMAVTFRTTAVEGAQMMEYQQPDVLGIGESAKERSGREQVKMGEDVEVEDIYDINVLLGEHNMWNADLRKLNKTFITSPVPSTPPPSPLTATNTDSDTTFLTAHGLPLLATTPTLTTLTASLLTLHHRLAVAEFIIDDPGVHAAAAASLSILESDGNGDGELRVKGEGEGEDDDVELELGRVMREVDAMKKKVDIAERVLGMDDDWVNAWVWVTAGGGMV